MAGAVTCSTAPTSVPVRDESAGEWLVRESGGEGSDAADSDTGTPIHAHAREQKARTNDVWRKCASGSQQALGASRLQPMVLSECTDPNLGRSSTHRLV